MVKTHDKQPNPNVQRFLQEAKEFKKLAGITDDTKFGDKFYLEKDNVPTPTYNYYEGDGTYSTMFFNYFPIVMGWIFMYFGAVMFIGWWWPSIALAVIVSFLVRGV